MPDPRSTMKRKKQQSIGNLITIKQYVVDILIILDYEPDYLEVYIQAVQILRELQLSDPTIPLTQYYEMLQEHPETVDLGTRYKYLIAMIDFLIDVIQLEHKLINILL